MRFASIVEKPLNETSEAIRCTSALKKRIIKRDDVLTHRKLDEILQHSFPVGLEKDDSTDDEDSDFSDDDVEGSYLSDPGHTEDALPLDSESSSDEEQWDIARADLEHIQCVFTSFKMPKMKSVTYLIAMQKKDLTRRLVVVFHITFPIYPLTFLNVFGHVT
jgi:hypothetical protein